VWQARLSGVQYVTVRPGKAGLAGWGAVLRGVAGKETMTGSELKKLRKKLDLSLAQAARQVEVSPRTWARWEAGDQEIPEGAMKLFRILNKMEKLK
jgi:DNA-binding transcriptional regulator YiaG